LNTATGVYTFEYRSIAPNPEGQMSSGAVMDTDEVEAERDRKENLEMKELVHSEMHAESEACMKIAMRWMARSIRKPVEGLTDAEMKELDSPPSWRPVHRCVDAAQLFGGFHGLTQPAVAPYGQLHRRGAAARKPFRRMRTWTKSIRNVAGSALPNPPGGFRQTCAPVAPFAPVVPAAPSRADLVPARKVHDDAQESMDTPVHPCEHEPPMRMVPVSDSEI